MMSSDELAEWWKVDYYNNELVISGGLYPEQQSKALGLLAAY